MAPERDRHDRQRTVGLEGALQQNGLSLSLSPVPTASGVARAAVRDRFTDALSRDAIADLALVVSELVSNAVEHGCGTVRLDVDLDGYGLHGFVADGGDGFDYVPSSADIDTHRGRGLSIVDALTTRWGIRAGSTHVWFDVASVRGATQ